MFIGNTYERCDTRYIEIYSTLYKSIQDAPSQSSRFIRTHYASGAWDPY